MKVAHYSTYLSRSAGGLFTSVSGLAKAQVEAGLDVVVVGGADQYFEEDRGQWADVSIRCHELSSGSYGLSIRAVKELARCKPDIIHVHGIWRASSFYARLFSAVGVPVVISPRGMLDPWILAQGRAVKRIHATFLERPVLRKAYVHALNQSEYESVVAYMPSVAGRTFVIPNGVGETAGDGRNDRTGFLYLGRLHAKKQVIELARIWASSKELQGTMLTIAGWGDTAYEEELVSAIDGTANVRFVGPLYGEAKESALNAAQFFILPSLSEGLPMAVLEALQHGVIPLITDQCNLPELFDAHVAVRIAPDLSDLADAASSAMALPEDELDLWSQVGMQFSGRYLWSTIAQQMRAHYGSIVEQGSS